VLAVVLSVLSVANSAEWSLSSETSATTLCGVGAASNHKGIAAAASNGIGAFVENFDGTKWKKSRVAGGLLLDSATSKGSLSVATSMYYVFVSSDNGATYSNSTAYGVSQSASIFNDGQSMGLVGSWILKPEAGKKPKTVTGVAVSSDSGKSWNYYEVPGGYVRYGAFPSTNTWFISAGIWGSSADNESSKFRRMSSRIKASSDGISMDSEFKATRKSGEDSGWFGSVSKTTDGGKTFTEVLRTPSDAIYYFNGISCSSETHCAVVGEGEDAVGNYLTLAFTTFDGGNTWAQTFTSDDVSLMGVKLISETEGWLGGTDKQGRNLLGQFYTTADGGKTWSLKQSLDNCVMLDMDFVDDMGFAACCSSNGSSCSVAKYA